jgi:hypothetical protein
MKTMKRIIVIPRIILIILNGIFDYILYKIEITYYKTKVNIGYLFDMWRVEISHNAYYYFEKKNKTFSHLDKYKLSYINTEYWYGRTKIYFCAIKEEL